MNLNIKNNKIFYIFSSIIGIVFCSLIFIASGKISSKISAEINNSSNTKTVILDAGHGGEDGGAVGLNNITEKDVNLKIALKLRDLLNISGYKVIMTREKDEAIYDNDSVTLRQKKISDLRNRKEIINKNKNNNTIFVSIHQNKFKDPKYFGTQIFYSKNDPKSQELAMKTRESVTSLIQPENTREIKPATGKIYLLNNAQIPAIVIECGFLSNPEEAQKLSDNNYQQQLAFSILCGISNYFINN